MFSALAVPAAEWRNAFAQVRQFRHDLKRTDGIFVYKEFHATDFVAGRGRIGDRDVPKGRRARIFIEAIRLVAALPGARLFNAVFPAAQDERAFERLLNRINRTMQAWDSRAILIIDSARGLLRLRPAPPRAPGALEDPLWPPSGLRLPARHPGTRSERAGSRGDYPPMKRAKPRNGFGALRAGPTPRH